MKMFKLSTILVVVLGIVGCEYVIPTVALRGYEQNDRDCSDGRDNDVDGLVDCEDPDCFYNSVHCGENNVDSGLTLEENTVARCHDFIDNDGDGQYDCADKECQNLPEACCSYEFTDAACSNGIDDDQNGRVDCDDYSCYKGIFVTVCDGSFFSAGQSQYALEGDADSEDTVDACSDGIDNDGNGYTDCEDFGCSKNDEAAVSDLCRPESYHVPADWRGLSTDARDELVAKVLDVCQDGEDNDGDGFIDCEDFDCSWNPLALTEDGEHLCAGHRVCE